MDIKDFKEGKSAFVLNMHTGRNAEPTIHETKVEKVGRKYVMVSSDRKYEYSSDPYSLVERIDWGERTLLCPTMEHARMYIEREELRRWLYRAVHFGKEYSLRQLREVKRILEGQDS